jgi:hypothetical protein
VGFEKKGIILKVTIDKGEIKIVASDPLAGPADFMMNKRKELIVPAMLEGNIMKIELDKNF